MSAPAAERRALVDWLISEPVVLAVIVLNAIALFLDGFPKLRAATYGALEWVDYGCMLFFVAEAVFKIRRHGIRGYLRSGWNRLDFLVVLGSLPLLAAPFVALPLEEFAVLLLLRLGRLLRFSRVMRFVPNASDVARGVMRALKASVAVFLVLFVLNLILAMGANLLFGEDEATQPYFGDPLISFYSLFKVFTVEGWYDIPDQVASAGADPGEVLLLRLYFVFSVLVGGILGLSMANAVFVDEMTADNTRKLEGMVEEMHADLQALRDELRRRSG